MPSVVNRDRDVWLCENDLSPKLLHLTSTGKFIWLFRVRDWSGYIKSETRGKKKEEERENHSPLLF